MNLTQVLMLRAEAEYLFSRELIRLAGAEGKEPWRCPPMLGYSQIEEGRYKLAIRVRNIAELPHKVYEELENRTGGDIDLRVVGTITLLGERAPNPTFCQRMRPLVPGLSIGQALSNSPSPKTGSLGCFVKKKDHSGLFLLSNSHIISEPNSSIGTEIIQPGVLDNGDLQCDVIANLFESLNPTPASPNEVDAAIAKLKLNEVGENILPEVGIIREIERDFRGNPTLKVYKAGRSGLTQGKVTAVGLKLHVHISGEQNGGLEFVEQIEITGIKNSSFAQKGDSGSLVVDENGKAIGLLFAVGDSTAYANPIDKVFDKLQIDFP